MKKSSKRILNKKKKLREKFHKNIDKVKRTTFISDDDNFFDKIVEDEIANKNEEIDGKNQEKEDDIDELFSSYNSKETDFFNESNEDLKNLMNSEKKKTVELIDVVKDFFIEETINCKEMKKLKEFFVDPIKQKNVVSKEIIKEVFSDFEKSFEKSKTFMKDLENAISGVVSNTLGKEFIIEMMLNFFENYKEYYNFVENIEISIKTLVDLMKKSKNFENFVLESQKELSKKLKEQKGILEENKDISEIEQIKLLPYGGGNFTMFTLMVFTIESLLVHESFMKVLLSNELFLNQQQITIVQNLIKSFNDTFKKCNYKSAKFLEVLKIIELNEILNCYLHPIENVLVLNYSVIMIKKEDNKEIETDCRLYLLEDKEIKKKKIICSEVNNSDIFVCVLIDENLKVEKDFEKLTMKFIVGKTKLEVNLKWKKDAIFKKCEEFLEL